MKFPGTKNARPVTVGRWIRLNLVLTGLALLVSWGFPVSMLSDKLNDSYFQLRRPEPVSSHVALVLIDETSLAEYGRWPWHRALLARLIHAVGEQRPRAVGVDILLPEPEDEQNDRELAQAIQAGPNVVLAAKISSAPTGRLWIDPLPRFAQAATGVGHVQAVIDSDGLCRSIPIQEADADGLRPAFSLQLAALLQPHFVRLTDSSKPQSSGIERLQAGAPLIIDYHRQFEPGQDPPPFAVVSAADLLGGKSHPELAGKAVLIGFGSIEVSDRLFTPVSNQLPMSGVEINANVVDMLLTGRSLRRIGAMPELLLVVVASMIFIWLVVRRPGVHGLLLLAGLLVLGYFAAFFLFLRFHYLLSYGPILVAGILAAPIAQLESLLIVDREVTSRLQHLRNTIRPHYEQLPPTEKGSVAPDLHWKLAALKDLQAELSSLYAFNQTLLETMREGLAVFDANGTLRFSNASWKKFCETQNVTLSNLGAVGELLGGWQELGHDTSAWTEKEISLGAGWWLFRAVRLPWTSFAAAGAVLLMVEDITARRQRDQARSEALSFVTHELRTPLISIQGFSELLMRYPNSPRSSEAPATIFRETNRLVAMINTYLEVLRLDAGARPLRRTAVNVRKMLDHVEKVVQPLAASAHIPVKTEIYSSGEYVLCDETLISGALLNLVSNAIKYGTRGSEVILRVTSLENEIEFAVHNSGPAIPPDELEHIFERFYRPARSESIPGWGLGLSFVQRICQQHGGRIQVSSNEISGTSFAFLLPQGACHLSEVTP